MHLEISDVVSIIALLASSFSIYLSLHLHDKTIFQEAYATNASLLIDLAKDMESNPLLLNIHGISDSDLEEAGLTSHEFVYLYRDFLIGSIFYLTYKKKLNNAMEKQSYRYKLLKQRKVQKAWPLIKRILKESEYTILVDNAINEINNK